MIIVSLAEVPHARAVTHFVVKDGVIASSATEASDKAPESLVEGDSVEASSDVAGSAYHHGKTTTAPAIARDVPIDECSVRTRNSSKRRSRRF